MNTLLNLVTHSPLLDVAGIDLKKCLMTLDISTLAEVPMARRVGLIPYTTETREALAEARQQITMLPDGAKPARAFYTNIGKEPALEVTTTAAEFTIYHCRAKDGEPSHWWGTERRTDSTGAIWSRPTERMVMDNFGNLVEVAA